MQHRIATAGWSRPGGVEHAIASWGYLSGPIREYPGTTLARDRGQDTDFARMTEPIGVEATAAGTGFRPVSAPAAFAGLSPRSVVADLTPASRFCSGTQSSAFVRRGEEPSFAGAADAVRFLGGKSRATFRVRAERVRIRGPEER
jgi:hypothetical protein